MTYAADSGRRLGNGAASIEVNDGAVYIPVLAVEFEGGTSTYGPLDTGSNATFCTEETARIAGINRRRITYSLDTLNQQAEKKHSWMVDLQLKRENGGVIQLSNVYLVQSIPLQTAVVDWSHLKQYHHL